MKRRGGESWIEPWWAPTFSRSEEEAEGPATGLIKRRYQGRKETRIVFVPEVKERQRFKEDRVIS